MEKNKTTEIDIFSILMRLPDVCEVEVEYNIDGMKGTLCGLCDKDVFENLNGIGATFTGYKATRKPRF